MEENTTKVQKNYLPTLRKLPGWFISGVIIFPVLAISGIALNLISLGKINPLFWIIIPAVIFEELFETSFFAFSNNQVSNFIFVIIFWFCIGGLTGWITGKLIKSLTIKT